MEAKLGGKLHLFREPVVSELNVLGKRSVEWDLNDWRWDGDFLRASPLNPVPSDCRSRHPVAPDIPVKNGSLNFLASLSDKTQTVLEDETEKRASDKRRRYIEVNEEHEYDESGSLDLMLGGQVFPTVDRDTNESGKSGRKSKLCGEQSSRAVCQVENCKADLSNAKDYHRRHKVCDVHSKANRASVGSIVQRFCQQCSRFHVLEEFDEGKRSCRRRLAGHNKRRRKAHPENAVGSAGLGDEQGSKYLLISLLRILSNIQYNSSDQAKDQDLLSHLLRNLATLSSSTNITNPRGLLPVSQDLQDAGTSCGTTIRDNGSPNERALPLPQTSLMCKDALTDNAQVGPAREAPALCYAIERRVKMNHIDLNSVYDDSEDHRMDNVPLENVSPCVSPWSFKDSQRSSPPQSQSPSTSSGEAQSRTGRIVFKLFGKDPSDFPLGLRKQMIDWLSSSPTDIESYIRPGCIILTIYACMDKSSWDELNCNLHSSLRRLLDASSDPFWTTDWIYTRVEHHASFVYNGQVALDMPVLLRARESCRISMISPIAVSLSETVHFSVKGYNLSGSTSRLLCALEGKYIFQESCADVSGAGNGEIQCLQFSCGVPNVVGRGFVEVEDYCLNSSFFPFIVAEKDVCAAICDLEKIMDVIDSANLDADKTEARNQALNFLHEMGWLLHKNSLILRLGEMRDDVDLFSFRRFKYLIEFSIDHGWPAVVRKLLNVFFDGTVDTGKDSSAVAALLDLGLLHRAVRRNSIPMVKFLLEYEPSGISPRIADAHKQTECGSFLFRPDSTGPGGLTPLHIAAGLDDTDDLLDALTEDPQSVGIGAWKSIHDYSGLTPHDYACLRGHYSYNYLVQRKELSKKHGQVVIDVPGTLLDDVSITKQKMADVSSKVTVFHTEKTMGEMMSCRKCEHMMSYGNGSSKPSISLHRPAMLSMVLIAAVCVCAALLFKSSPEVVYLFRPFRWELLKYGAE